MESGTNISLKLTAPINQGERECIFAEKNTPDTKNSPEEKILTQEEYAALKAQYQTELGSVQRKQNLAQGITLGSGIASVLLLAMAVGIRDGKIYQQYQAGRAPEQETEGTAAAITESEDHAQWLPERQYDQTADEIYRPTTVATEQPS